MADIELVIKIPSKVYENIKSATADDNDISYLLLGIHEATPLRKGHGRIVDIGPYEGKVIANRTYCGVNKLVEIAELDTIIEADKEEEE